MLSEASQSWHCFMHAYGYVSPGSAVGQLLAKQAWYALFFGAVVVPACAVPARHSASTVGISMVAPTWSRASAPLLVLTASAGHAHSKAEGETNTRQQIESFVFSAESSGRPSRLCHLCPHSFTPFLLLGFLRGWP